MGGLIHRGLLDGCGAGLRAGGYERGGQRRQEPAGRPVSNGAMAERHSIGSFRATLSI
ncbi:hypothetical protein [Lysobacter gummosus]|uniref:hypothetical protein n=1 Tax=Lysobacter gummosus TaxID=262324 RepID=UPI003627CCE6